MPQTLERRPRCDDQDQREADGGEERAQDDQAAGGEDEPSILALTLVAEEIGIGAAVGIVVVLLGGRLIKLCGDRNWITETWRQLPVPALSVAIFALAQALGGSGFIAAFVGGLLFDAITKQHKHTLMLAAEGTADTLALITWVAFGSAVVGQMADYLTWPLLYAVLSLTLVRMLPVFVSLGGMGLGADEKLFIGWFGPRGLASVVFGVIVFNQNLPGGETIVATVVWTIILSVVGHGLSANPLATAFAARLGSRVRPSGER